MSVEKQLIKLDNLIELSNLLLENGYSNSDMTIVINVHTNELLKKINEDIYYRNKEENNQPINENVDEIDLNINGINFKYIKD